MWREREGERREREREGREREGEETSVIKCDFLYVVQSSVVSCILLVYYWDTYCFRIRLFSCCLFCLMSVCRCSTVCHFTCQHDNYVEY